MSFLKRALLLISIITLCCGCTVKYSFSGASISPEMKTVTIEYFPNNAAMVAATLTSTFNDQFQQKIQRETRLQLVPENGDGIFEGEIYDYRTDPVAISGDEFASKNRLTIAVKVKYTDKINPKNSFESKIFSGYEDYDAQQMLSSVESTLIPQIVQKIVQDIFNAAYSNW